MKTRVGYKDLESRVLSRLQDAGIAPLDCEIVAAHLLDAEYNGHASHGLSRLAGILTQLEAGGYGHPTPTVKPTGNSSATYDADRQLGIAAMHTATDECIRRSLEGGVSAVAVQNYRGTTGEIGAFARQAARVGVVALIFAGSEYAVAPLGSSRAILGTNPIAIAFPHEPNPFSADMATAAWSYGRIKQAERDGQNVPFGVVQTEDGKPSNNPADADNGSQLPMAGHKGYALGLAVELLCGPLVGGGAGRDAVKGSDASLILGIDAGLFRPAALVAQDTEALFDEVRNAPLAEGATQVRIPGDQRSLVSPTWIEVDIDQLKELGLT